MSEPVSETNETKLIRAIFGKDYEPPEKRKPRTDEENKRRDAMLTKSLDCLPDLHRYVLERRYGLLDYEPATLQEIADAIGEDRARARQIEIDALRLLARLPR